jgi:hypothetical protein
MATPIPQPSADTEDSNSTELKLGSLSKLLSSDGVTVNKNGKEYKIGKDGISVRGGNSNPSSKSNSASADTIKPSSTKRPGWVPIPNGGVITSQTAPGSDAGKISLTSRFSENEVRDFYRNQFTKMGWTVTELQQNGAGILVATGDGKRVQIATSAQGSGETLVVIDYSTE